MAKLHHFAFALCATLALAGCAAPPVETVSTASLDPQQCAAQGGLMAKRGMVGITMCVVPFKDGGKTCSGSVDCQGKCFASTAIGWREHPIGTPAKGKCQYENTEFGCMARVEHGRIASQFLCTD
jgi:hypothetical protein